MTRRVLPLRRPAHRVVTPAAPTVLVGQTWHHDRYDLVVVGTEGSAVLVHALPIVDGTGPHRAHPTWIQANFTLVEVQG